MISIIPNKFQRHVRFSHDHRHISRSSELNMPIMIMIRRRKVQQSNMFTTVLIQIGYTLLPAQGHGKAAGDEMKDVAV